MSLSRRQRRRLIAVAAMSCAFILATGSTSALASSKYHVTYSLGSDKSESAPTHGDVDNGSTFTLATPPSINRGPGKTFLGWKDDSGNIYHQGVTYHVGNHDVQLTASWSDDSSSGDDSEGNNSGGSTSHGSNIRVAPTISSVAISGVTTVGDTLTATPAGVTGNPTPTATYQWKISTSASGPFTNISGATTSTYALQSGDTGKFIQVSAFETNTVGTSQTVSSSVTPKITAPSKTVVFDPNCTLECIGFMSSQSSNVPAALSNNSYLRIGYSFSGWNTAANGSGTPYVNGALFPFTSDLTLYAQWTPITFTVSFNSNGGTGSMTSQTGTILSITHLAANTLTRAGYSFAGWDTAANGSGISYADRSLFPFVASVTLYAQWLALPTPTPTPTPTPSAPIQPSLTPISTIKPNSVSNSTPTGTSSVTAPIETPAPTPVPTKTPTPLTPPASIPTPKTKLTSAQVQKLAPGLLVPHASKKLLVANQVVALSESISIKAPVGYSFFDLIINGKKYKVAITDLSNIPLPVLVGPKDKVVVELIDANGNVLDDPITQQSSNVALANVNFDVAKYSLSKAAKTALDKVAKVVVQHGFTFIDLTGYTDAQGLARKFNNQKLSQQRGQMTAAYLKSKLGKAKISIKVEAKAHLNPVASNSTPAGQAMNRRVEISVH